MGLYFFIFGGLALAAIFNFAGVQNSQWYLLTVGTLLAAGLYTSTYGISLQDAKKHAGLILRAITIGVFLKAFIVGAFMSLLLQNPIGFIFGIAVAQIDPLSTAALMRGNRMTKRAKAILGAWASFDDPMTVIMSLYAPILVSAMAGTHWEPVNGTMQQLGLAGYVAETGINLLFAGGAILLWHLMKRHSKATNYVVIALLALGMYGLLLGAMSVAVYYFWMLGIAVLGLFMRPPIEPALDHIIRWALYMAAVLLGVLLIDGIDIWAGIALGFAAYSAQIIVGLLLTKALPHKDRMHIAFAQQNGITAIILALLFETYYPGTIAIVAPAIVTINSIHYVANKVLDAHLEGDHKRLGPRHHMEKLKTHIHKV